MKVIVNTSGFYGGTWFDAGSKEVEIHDRVAKPFLPPFGHQLAVPSAKKVAIKTDKAD